VYCPGFLLALFVGSGCAALIYEIVWLQLLQLSIGSSAVSLAAVRHLHGRDVPGQPRAAAPGFARHHPLRVFAVVELGIGVSGVAILFGMPYIDRFHAVSVLCLIPPTMLMGASLPAIARWIEATPQGVSWLGYFYGGNIAGAVFGCLLRVLPVEGIRHGDATMVAVVINGTVALAAFTLAARAPHRTPREIQPQAVAAPAPAPGRSTSRSRCRASVRGRRGHLDSLAIPAAGATVYTFSVILAVFLMGLGGGRPPDPHSREAGSSPGLRSAPARCCCRVDRVGRLRARKDSSVLEHRRCASLESLDKLRIRLFALRLRRSAGACLWGASFPLALAAAAQRGRTRETGRANLRGQ